MARWRRSYRCCTTARPVSPSRSSRSGASTASRNGRRFRMSLLLVGSAVALLAWLGLLLSPHQPHRARERLEADPAAPDDLSAVTVLMPARDEAELIGRAIASLG